MYLRFGHSSKSNNTSRLFSRKIDTWLVQPLAKGTYWLLGGTSRLLPATPLVSSSSRRCVCRRETNRQGSHAWRYRTSFALDDMGSMLCGNSCAETERMRSPGLRFAWGSCQAGCGHGVEPRSVPTDNVGVSRGVQLN